MTQETQTPDESSIDSGEVASPLVAEADQPVLAAPAKPDLGGFYLGTGRRKASVARVRIKPGDGKFVVNGHKVEEYFTEDRDRNDVVAPLKATKTEDKLDVFVKVHGGGYMGQAGAVLLGLSRALKGYDPTLEPVLRENDFLSRDPREVERKKYGQRGARRKFQFSKR